MDIIDNLKLDASNYIQNMNKATQTGVAGLNKVQMQAGKATGAIKGIFAGLITASAVKNAIVMAEGFQNITGTIKNATSSLAEFEAFQKSTFESAQRLGLSYEDMASSVTALIPPMKAIGANTQQIQDFTEALQAGFKANAFSGGDAVIKAIAKSFNKGKIDAKAFQQALIAIPDLAQNIGNQLGLTEQQVKELGASGELTNKQFVNAVASLKGAYGEQAKNVNSLSNAFNYLKNALGQYLAGANQASGFTKILSNGVKILADNIDKVVLATAVFGSMKLATMIGGIVASVTATATAVGASTRAWIAETTAIMANTKAKTANAIASGAQGAGLAVSGLSKAGTAVANIAGLGAGLNRVFTSISGILKVGIVGALIGIISLSGQWSNIVDSVKYIFNDLKGVISFIGQGFQGLLGSLKQFISQSDSLNGVFKQFDSGIFGIFEMVGRLADGVVSGLKAIFGAIIQNTVATLKTIGNVITKPIRAVLEMTETAFNSVIDKYNSIAEKINLKPIDFKLDFSQLNEKLTFNADFLNGDEFKTLFNEYQSEQKQSGLEAYFRQMKADIEASRAIASEANKARQGEVDNIADFNQAIKDKIKDTKGIQTGTSADAQLEIDRLYRETPYKERDRAFYAKIDELNLTISKLGQINWNEYYSKMGLPSYSELGVGSKAFDFSEMAQVENNNIQALQENTQALKAVSGNEHRQPEIKVNVIGNIENMREFVKVEIDNSLNNLAYAQ